MSLLAISLLGLYSHRQPGGLWRILFTQGVAWIALASLAYIPLVVFKCLNLNGTMDIIRTSPPSISSGLLMRVDVLDSVIYYTRDLCDTDTPWSDSTCEPHSQARVTLKFLPCNSHQEKAMYSPIDPKIIISPLSRQRLILVPNVTSASPEGTVVKVLLGALDGNYPYCTRHCFVRICQSTEWCRFASE